MNIRVRVCKACLQSSLKSLSQISRSRILLVAILSSFPDVQMSIPSGTSVMTAVIQSTRFPSTLVYPLLSWFSYWPWELCLGTSTTTRNDRTGRLMLSSPPMKSSRSFKFTRFFFGSWSATWGHLLCPHTQNVHAAQHQVAATLSLGSTRQRRPGGVGVENWLFFIIVYCRSL